MWNGRWSKELDRLCQLYIDRFGEEPDCQNVEFDKVSYQEFRNAIIKSLALNTPVDFTNIIH